MKRSLGFFVALVSGVVCASCGERTSVNVNILYPVDSSSPTSSVADAAEAVETVEAIGDNGCLPQCHGKQCGPDGCGGTCGSCPPGQTCNTSGQCVCTPACAGKQCGPDGCGGTCGSCPPGQTCNTSLGKCQVPPPQCGNHSCEPGENCFNCPKDCGPCCGNGLCEPAYNENSQTCTKDCFHLSQTNNYVYWSSCQLSDLPDNEMASLSEKINAFDFVILGSAGLRPNPIDVSMIKVPRFWYISAIETMGIFVELYPDSAKIGYNPASGPIYDPSVTKDILISHIIPYQLQDGGEGLFIDTLGDLDDPSLFFQPGKIETYRNQAVSLVQAIRNAFPELLILVNEGRTLYDSQGSSLGNIVDGFVFQHLAYNPADAPITVSEVFTSLPSWRSDQIKAASSYGKPLFALEYVSPADIAVSQAIVNFDRKFGVVPYLVPSTLNGVEGCGNWCSELCKSVNSYTLAH